MFNQLTVQCLNNLGSQLLKISKKSPKILEVINSVPLSESGSGLTSFLIPVKGYLYQIYLNHIVKENS